MCLVIGVSMGGGNGRDAACERAAEIAAGVAADADAAAVVAGSAAEVRSRSPSPPPWFPPPPPALTRPVLSIVISCQPDGDDDKDSAWPSPLPSPSSFDEEEAEVKKRRRRSSAAIDEAFSCPLFPTAACVLESFQERPRAIRSSIFALFSKGRHKQLRAAEQPTPPR